MIDGVQGLYDVEVDLINRVSFVHQTGYTFFLKEEVEHAGSAGKESKLVW